MTVSAFLSALYIAAVGSGALLAGFAASAWRRSNVLDRALVGIIAATAATVGPALLLGMVGVLTAPAYLIVMIVVGAASAIYLLRHPAKAHRVPAAWSPAGMLAVAVSTGLAVLSFLPSVQALAQADGESRRYHITNLVSWARTHNIWRLPFQAPGVFTATHPGNGELVAIGLLFATGRDQFVYVTFALFAAIAVIACASIARDLGGRPDSASLTMIAILATPIVYGTQAHALMTDLAAAASLLAGVACLVRAHHEHDRRWVLLAGFAIGLGLGSKYTVLLLAIAVCVGAIIILRPRKQVWLLAPGLAFFAAPWFVRNWVKVGNPIFPQGVTVGGHQILRAGSSPLLVLATTIGSHVLNGRWLVLGKWWHLLWRYWGPATLIVFAGVVSAAVLKPRQRDRIALAGLCVLGLLVYATTPFTGAGLHGLTFLLGSNLRYLIPAALIGACVAAVVVPSRVLFVLVAGTFAFDAYSMLRGYGFRRDLDVHTTWVVAAVGGAVVVCVAVTLLGRRTLPVRELAIVGALAACILLAAALVRIDGRVRWTPLEKLVVSTRAKHVGVLGGNDFRSILGPNLDTQLEDIVGGRPPGDAPPRNAAILTKDVEASTVGALVVNGGTPGIPVGWAPPASKWKLVGTAPGGTVYVRTS